jgi:hypothetical protein
VQTEDIIGRELEPEEKQLWAGCPRQGIVLRGSDAIMIPFSIMWGGFAIFWEVTALGIVFGADAETSVPGAVAVIFPLFGIPFVIIGLYLMVGRFFLDAKARANTTYGVTNTRAIIVSGIRSRQVKSLSLRTLSDITVTEKGDGTGTITMGASPPFASMYAGMQWPGMQGQMPPRFDMIPNVKEVYSLMRASQGDT